MPGRELHLAIASLLIWCAMLMLFGTLLIVLWRFV